MNYLNAFWVGGLICALCQVLIDKTKLTPARILVSLVVLGVILQGLGWYQAVVDYAGAGATVPLLGFGYSLAKGVAKAVAESGLLGGLVLLDEPRNADVIPCRVGLAYQSVLPRAVGQQAYHAWVGKTEPRSAAVFAE